ncbi:MULTISPECIES: malto-oligosyltrehalose trehalohydrolase [Micrococcaceae]|uniref:malto-oligosyltrehalose trehalohydrolase n=1 Tax=Micrococcaceae TaxID=1268 RepID=UPI001607D584|nr:MULTISPECIES: malto-oligosyltrehalose trehalohydrolase [Micrococcaceae]MBB5747804.1 maltooligosyltrehalose trehalohydrolase [Micrococcus sp. TA1]HRO30528.1 malto-oligosyltrehalose trehalohydrolase [Citricoccus sp.]HRO93856.1 malto-oligosyltrehalose trehalohydrolase [Citricoccus sp.]
MTETRDRGTSREQGHSAHPRDTRWSVWAPEAGTVELMVTDREPGAVHDSADRWAGAQAFPMEPAGDGWWVPGATAPGGTDVGYGYRVDGEGPFPDPRSRCQPDTVHGPSRLVDAEAYDWHDGDWTGRPLRGAVIYELHVGTFTPEGTLAAAVDRLGHLVSLGVTHVELLPVNSFGGRHNWGYDGVGWYAVDASYGGPEAYRRFVDACHAAGLAVLQDVVYNHLGPSGNYLPKFGPYLTEQSTGWGSGLNLDGPDSDEVRRYILDNVRMWAEEYHVDGFRLDAVHALHDTRAVHVLEEMAAEVDALSARLGRPLVLVAESDLNDPRMISPRAPGGAGGHGLTGQWSDDFHHAVHVALTGETEGYYADFASLDALGKVLNEGFFHDGTYSSFRRRHHGRPLGEHTPAEALVVCTQNHDQVGNRATGDRLTASLDEGRLAIGAALLMAGPFTPMLFMGEEWAASTPWQFFTAHREPELAEAVTQGRRREFERMAWDHDAVPDPQAEQTFRDSTLRWEEAGTGRHARLLELYRRLAALRAELPELTDPDRATTHATVDAGRRHLRLDRGLRKGAADVGTGVGVSLQAGGHGAGSVVLLAAFGEDPLPVPPELAGHRLLAGHGVDGPVPAGDQGGPAGEDALPASVPAPGFLLLGRR